MVMMQICAGTCDGLSINAYIQWFCVHVENVYAMIIHLVDKVLG